MSPFPSGNRRRVGLNLVGSPGALAPLWLDLVAKFLLDPAGFWQHLVPVGLGMYVLGGMPVVCVIGLAIWLAVLWK